MKKKFCCTDWIINQKIRLFLFIALIIAFQEATAQSSTELDRQFKLETIGCLRSWDNVGGLLAESVVSAYKDFFAKQGRYVFNDLSPADALLSQAKISYKKIIEDSEILKQLTHATHTDSLIRTKILKEGQKYFITLDWLHPPQMELIATENFTLSEPEQNTFSEKDFLTLPLQTHLDLIMKKIRLLSTVTRCELNSINVNLTKTYNA